MVDPVPTRYHTVTPYLIVSGAADLIRFMVDVFGAVESPRMENDDGTIAHAEVEIGDSIVMVADSSDRFPPASGWLHVYLADCDAAHERAVTAGAESVQEPADQFYGDRTAGVRDPFGNTWWLATHVEDVPPEEMAKRAAAAAG